MTQAAARPHPSARPRVVHVVQGEFIVSDEPDVALATLLGSCVAACMRDPLAGVGGMNHFLLPGALAGDTHGLERGVHAMELLINALLRAGARRERLEAKLFGGARMIKNLSDVGAQNAAFAEEFLRQERIAFRGASLGGEQARMIRYWPVSGAAKQMLVGTGGLDVFAREMKVAIPPPSETSDIEFFD